MKGRPFRLARLVGQPTQRPAIWAIDGTVTGLNDDSQPSMMDRLSLCSRTGRAGFLTGWTGTLQADAYGGYNDLYHASHRPAPVLSALCWSRKPMRCCRIGSHAIVSHAIVSQG